MSAESSPTTPKAKPAKLAAPASPPSPVADTFDRMEHFKARYPTQGLGDRFSSARNLAHTRAPSPTPPRSSFEDAARAPPSLNPLTPSFNPSMTTGPASLISHVATDGSLGRSSAGSRIGAVPGNYRSPFDYNLIHRAPTRGTRSFAQQYSFAEPSPAQALPTTSAPAPAASVPAPTLVHQIRAVIPPLGTAHRLVLLGPLRMIRSQCARKEILQPILIWIDRFMGEELRTPVWTDALISSIIYAVNIPMDDEHWHDYNKVLAVFPRAAAWQKALPPEEPFDEVTADHPTMTLFREGEELESLLADLVQTYNLGIQFDVNRPWDLPGQTDWRAPEAREAHTGH